MAQVGTVFFIALLAIIAIARALKTNVNSEAPAAKAEEPTSAVKAGLEETAVTRYSSSGYYKGGKYYKYGKNPRQRRHPRHPRHHGRPSKSLPCKCYRHEHQATRQCRRYRGYCGIVSCGYHRYPHKGYSCCGSGHYKPGHHSDYSDYYEEYYGKDYYGDDYYGEDGYGKDCYGKDYKGKYYYGGEYYDDEYDGHRKNW